MGLISRERLEQEVVMVVKVLMKRQYKEGMGKEAFALIRKMRTRAMDQRGYISGETLIDPADDRKTMVIGTWQSMEDWLNWKNDPRRKECEEQLEQLLEVPAEYETYVYKYRVERMMATA